jgi:hypothetical protein
MASPPKSRVKIHDAGDASVGMAEISITDAQQTAIKEIRSDLEEAYVDTYGHVRTQDVVQYLLDTYTPPEKRHSPAKDAYEQIATATFPTLQRVAAEVEDVPGSGIDADTMRGKLLSTLGAEELTRRLEDIDSDTSNGSVAEPTTVASTTASAEIDSDSDPESEANTEGSTPSTHSSEESDTEDESASTESVLASANQLLDDHKDKWRQAPKSDSPYEVELPDGTTAQARTKDDVRQLLFKHY